FAITSFNIISFPWNLSGLLFIYAGIALNGEARKQFKEHSTPHNFDEPKAMINTGIFAKTRNPMYLGMSLFILGIALCFGNLIGLLAAPAFAAIANAIYIPFEEKELRMAFGESYDNYKSTVRRWI
ncbi:MAG: methyltransferase family protein, partial [Candidatus Kapaibacterium sp.]